MICPTGKVQYYNKARAQRSCHVLDRNRRLVAYHCKTCRHWHIGHKK